jgi:hypothetical protein
MTKASLDLRQSILTYCFLRGVVVHDSPVLHRKCQGVIPWTVQQVRQRGHKAVQNHCVDAQGNPARSVAPAGIVAQHYGYEKLANVIANRDDPCARDHTLSTLTASLYYSPVTSLNYATKTLLPQHIILHCIQLITTVSSIPNTEQLCVELYNAVRCYIVNYLTRY